MNTKAKVTKNSNYDPLNLKGTNNFYSETDTKELNYSDSNTLTDSKRQSSLAI